jgi:hypothetical protein
MEKRFLSLASESLIDAAEIVIELDPPAVSSLALELALLLGGLANSLRVQSSKGPTLRLTLMDDDRVAQAVATRESDGSASFALGKNQARYLQVVLLRAYRDQMAEVNHVHIDGKHGETPFGLTVMFKVFREPMSPQQASRLLDE